MVAEKTVNHRKEILRGLGVLAVGGVLFVPVQMAYWIVFIIIRSVVLNTWGALATPEWGTLEWMFPESKVQIVSGRSEVAGTPADGLMRYYTIRIPSEDDRRAFDDMLRQQGEKDWYWEGSYTLNFNASSAAEKRWMQVTVTPKEDGLYELSFWDH